MFDSHFLAIIKRPQDLTKEHSLKTKGVIAGLIAASIWGGMYVVSKVVLEVAEQIRIVQPLEGSSVDEPDFHWCIYLHLWLSSRHIRNYKIQSEMRETFKKWESNK